MNGAKNVEQEKMSALLVFSGSFFEGLIGAGTVALGIIGLLAIAPMYMAAVATIAVGAAFFIEGFALGARFRTLTVEIFRGAFDATQFGSGVLAEFIGGSAGIVLGILALMGIYQMVLVPIAVLTYGTTLILGSGAVARLNALKIEERVEREENRRVAKDAVVAAASIQVIVGLASIVLGILALLGLYPLVLSLVALLSIAFSDLFSGTAIVGRMVSLFRY
jgi:hypothetical protein